MRVVNLARRPFVNRRPVVRFAVAVWIVGVLLLLWNIQLYRGHWLGSAENRRLVAEAEREVETEQRLVDGKMRRLPGTSAREAQNRRAEFLNSLIAYRTFPWSNLFEDLEGVLPSEVWLTSVRPQVRLAEDVERERSRATRRRTRAARMAALRRSAAEQRRARSAAAAADEENPGSEESGAESAAERAEETAAEAAAETVEESSLELAPDEVSLQLLGYAASEEELFELVDRLYANPAFRRPVLSNEQFDQNKGATGFSLGVVYLTRRGPQEPPPEEPPPEEPPPEEPPVDEALSFGELDASATPGLERGQVHLVPRHRVPRSGMPRSGAPRWSVPLIFPQEVT